MLVLVLQARDPSVHAAILAHLNQKYGSGSDAAPDAAGSDSNKLVSKLSLKRCSDPHVVLFQCKELLHRFCAEMNAKVSKYLHFPLLCYRVN